MASEKHPLDAAAERLEAAAEAPVADQAASADFWELNFAADETVGDYPQALSSDEDDEDDWGDRDDDFDDEGFGEDGFPDAPGGLPPLELQESAHWTDVLSSSLWDEGYLLNEKAHGVFRQHELGSHRTYSTQVTDASGSERPYQFIFLQNLVDPSAFDFARSEFYIEDTLGRFQCPVEINSFKDWLDLSNKANEGQLEGVKEFSSVAYRKLFLKRENAPTAELFTLSRLGVQAYISTRFKNALVEKGVTGLEIRPNRRLFLS